MLGLFTNAQIKRLQKMVADEREHVRELLQALDNANKTTQQSVDNFTTLHGVYVRQREMLEQLMGRQ